MTPSLSGSIKSIEAPKPPVVTRLVKIVLVTISSAAALVSVLNFAKENLGEAGGKPVAMLASRSVAWVRTMPAVDTATALGDTVRFAATVADKNGSTLNTAPVLWTTSDKAVATVDGHGQVIARGPGTATITATAGEHVAQSRVVVRPAVASVSVVIPGDSVARLGEGESRGLAARAADRRGYVIGGKRATWRSADTSVAVIDSMGRLEGRAVGRTMVIASLDGSAAEVPVEVRAVPASLEHLAPTSDGALLAPAGRTLPQRVTVRVMSQRGEPAREVPVRFTVSDEGEVEPAVIRTTSEGLAAVTWTLGSRPGRQRMFATVDGVDSALVIVAEADPLPSDTKWATLSTELSGRVGEPLAQRAAVRLQDAAGRPLPDVPISWAADHGGEVSSADARTDSLGEARATWTLGRAMGRQKLRVHAGSARAVPPHFIVAEASAGAPAKVSLVSGGAQSATVGSTLAKAVRVKVTDQSGNPTAGARVMVLATAGRVADSVVTTDSSGLATIKWTLGRTSGAQQVIARPEGVEPALTIGATARPRPAADVEATVTPETAPGTKPLQVQLVVRDEYGNPVPEARVQLATAEGSGTVVPHVAVSDPTGAVAATWTLGRPAGEQKLTVKVAGTKVGTTVTAVATEAPAASPKPAAAKPATRPATKPATKPSTSKTKAKATTSTPTRKPPRRAR